MVTNVTGAVQWQWPCASDSFCEAAPLSLNAYALNLRFPGQYFDAESGLAYNVHRDYEAASGRYVQSDPMGLFGGKSTYAYVINNPLIGIDPLELTNLTLGANVSAIAGGGFTAGGGLYVSYGAGGFDVGVYGSVGGGIGANIGVGISGGYVPGSSSNLSGQTVDANLSGGTFQCTGSVAVDPNLTGSGSVGLGLGLLAGASLTTTQSGHFGLQDAEGWFSDHFGSKCH